jgi:G3E family GTPase
VKPLTPVFVLSGFLGSGKTTLLNSVLKNAAFANTAVVVNEFGEIGLDHLLIRGSTDSVVLLEAGCLCCTIADSLHETLADLNFQRIRGEIPAFERVIVETTGLADPAPILNTLLGHRLVTDYYRLDAVVVTADAQHAMEGLNTHPEIAKQLAIADRIVVTKLDLAKYPDELISRLRMLNPAAALIEYRDQACAAAVFGPVEKHRLHTQQIFAASSAGEHGHTYDVFRHDAKIHAYSFVMPDPASWAGIAAWWRQMIEVCGDGLLRCKGIVRIRDTGEIVFLQCVQRIFHRPERLAVWPDSNSRSRIVCIARDVDEGAVRRTLDALQLSADSHPN